MHQNNLEICRNCALCCSWPGVLPLLFNDEVRIAHELNLSLSEFRNRYITGKNGSVTLISKNDGACIFLVNNCCSVYRARPRACRVFPEKNKITQSLISKCYLARLRAIAGDDHSEKGA